MDFYCFSEFLCVWFLDWMESHAGRISIRHFWNLYVSIEILSLGVWCLSCAKDETPAHSRCYGWTKINIVFHCLPMVVSSLLTNEMLQRAPTMPSNQFLCPFSFRLNDIRAVACWRNRYCLLVTETKFFPGNGATQIIVLGWLTRYASAFRSNGTDFFAKRTINKPPSSRRNSISTISVMAHEKHIKRHGSTIEFESLRYLITREITKKLTKIQNFVRCAPNTAEPKGKQMCKWSISVTQIAAAASACGALGSLEATTTPIKTKWVC